MLTQINNGVLALRQAGIDVKVSVASTLKHRKNYGQCFEPVRLHFARPSSRDWADRLILSSDCDRKWHLDVQTVGVNMGGATMRSFIYLGAIFNDAADAGKEAEEIEAANENSGNAGDNDAKPIVRVVLCGDDARQGVTGHNVPYVLGFGILRAIVALTVVALMVGLISFQSTPASSVAKAGDQVTPVALRSTRFPPSRE
jgi:hypothetical protein